MTEFEAMVPALERHLALLTGRARELAGPGPGGGLEFDLNSPQQVAMVIFEVLKLPVPPGARAGKSGQVREWRNHHGLAVNVKPLTSPKILYLFWLIWAAPFPPPSWLLSPPLSSPPCPAVD